MSDRRQKNQLVLAFTEKGRSEAPKASQEGTESLTAKCETERPASHEQLMEEVCERRNCWQAYKRVKANIGYTFPPFGEGVVPWKQRLDGVNLHFPVCL